MSVGRPLSFASGRELRVRLEQQRAVADLGQLALGDVPLQELFDAAVEVVASGLQAGFASVAELLPDGSGLVLRSMLGWPESWRDREVVPAELRSQAGYTLTVDEPVITRDATAETRFSPSPQWLEFGITSAVSVRVGRNGGTYGVLSVHTREERVFSERDVAFLEAVAHVLGSSLRRHRAEEELEMSHRVLEAIVEGTTDSVFVKDTDGRFVVVNQAAAARLKRPREQLLGRTLHEVLAPDQADAMDRNDRLVLERGVVETFEEIVPFEPKPRVYLATKGPYRAKDGTLLGTFGIARDITDRKQQEQALRDANEYTDRLIETSNAIVLVLDTDANIRTFNRAAEELTGYGREEVLGRNWDVLLPRERFAEVWAEFDTLTKDGTPERYENPIVTKAGEERIILWQNSPLRDHDGAVVGTVSFGIDVTEARRATERAHELEEQLRQAEKLDALGQLAGGVAHDFNNLLLAIRGSGELALGGLERGDRDVAEDVRTMISAAEHAGELTRQLLAFGRRQVLNPEVVDLNDVVCEAAKMLDRLLGETVDLVTALGGSPLRVRADRSQLTQVITNLAVNARDAMPDGGTISITTSTRDGHVELAVADEGLGIDPEAAARIFEPFFTTKGEQGSGLGLATVYGIVAQSGGEITFDTEHGVGTTFKVTLPSAVERGASETLPATRAVHEGSERILLVEDDPRVRSIVKQMLEANGYDVAAVAGGAEAVALVDDSEEPPIDLVLTDIVMRGLDGRQATDRIRQSRPHTPVLFMSGYADDADIRTGGLGPSSAFIQKPFSGVDLAEKVRAVLEARKATG